MSRTAALVPPPKTWMRRGSKRCGSKTIPRRSTSAAPSSGRPRYGEPERGWVRAYSGPRGRFDIDGDRPGAGVGDDLGDGWDWRSHRFGAVNKLDIEGG